LKNSSQICTVTCASEKKLVENHVLFSNVDSSVEKIDSNSVAVQRKND
jgi:hypothetical protein